MQPALPKVPPVSADMETVCTQGENTSTSSAKFFRDEMSRTRIEQGDLTAISDPAKGQNFILNMPKKIAFPSLPKPPLPSMPALPGMPAPPQPGMPQLPQMPQLPEGKDLGSKVINGIKVQGKQFTMPALPAVPGAPVPPGVTGIPAPPALPGMPAPPKPGMPAPPPITSEVWTSPDLKLPIQSSFTNPATATNCVTQMKNVTPGAKLPPSMFQVPPDFKITPPPAPPAPSGLKK